MLKSINEITVKSENATGARFRFEDYLVQSTAPVRFWYFFFDIFFIF